MRLARYALVLLALLPTSARSDEIDDYIAERMKDAKIPGLSVAVVKDGEVLLAKGYGLADVELEARATAATVYEIGSITKQFTATAVMMLVEEGKLGLDDPITKYLDDLPEAWGGVTVRHLLNHTSGIKSYTSVGDFQKLARTDYKPDEILAMVRDVKVEFAPGEKWAYNNTGYYLLGLIIEKAGGKDYDDFLEERIFKPLGMERTRPNNPRMIIKGRASGYGQVLGILGNRDPITPSSSFSAGCLVSTVGDMAKWDRALREGKLLTSSSFEQMYAPTKLNDGETHPYGFGWAVGSYRGHKVLSHGGGTAGFTTTIQRFVDDGVTVIVLTNLSGGSDVDGIARGIARRFVPSLDDVEQADADPARTGRHKAIIEGILADKVDESAFEPKFHEFITSDEARRMTRQLVAKGPLKSFAFVEEKEQGQGRTLYYRAVLGDTAHLITINLDPEGKIRGLRASRDD